MPLLTAIHIVGSGFRRDKTAVDEHSTYARSLQVLHGMQQSIEQGASSRSPGKDCFDLIKRGGMNARG